MRDFNLIGQDLWLVGTRPVLTTKSSADAFCWVHIQNISVAPLECTDSTVLITLQ